MELMAIRGVEFSSGGTKLERFLPKNQHTQRKVLNFENWVKGVKKCQIQKHIFLLLTFFDNINF